MNLVRVWIGLIVVGASAACAPEPQAVQEELPGGVYTYLRGPGDQLVPVMNATRHKGFQELDRLEQIQMRLIMHGWLGTALSSKFRQGRAVLVKPEIPRIDVEMDVGIPEITGPEYALQYREDLENLLLWRENPWEGPTKAIQRSNRKHAIQTKREIAELLEEMSAILEAEKQDVERVRIE